MCKLCVLYFLMRLVYTAIFRSYQHHHFHRQRQRQQKQQQHGMADHLFSAYVCCDSCRIYDIHKKNNISSQWRKCSFEWILLSSMVGRHATILSCVTKLTPWNHMCVPSYSLVFLFVMEFHYAHDEPRKILVWALFFCVVGETAHV